MAVTKKAPVKKAAAKKVAPKKQAAAEKHAHAEESCCGSESCADAGPSFGSICHIDFEAPDVARAQAFYAELFGWKFYPYAPNSVYFTTTTDQMGGCINQGNRTSSSTCFYVTVNDIPASLAKAAKLGGKIVTPRTEICGGHGFYGQINDPAGNLVAVYARN